jgi:hypothetical protein
LIFIGFLPFQLFFDNADILALFTLIEKLCGSGVETIGDSKFILSAAEGIGEKEVDCFG